MLERVLGCRLATYRSYGACWSQFGAVGWQGFMGHVGESSGLHVGNLQVLWGMLEQVWGCRLATYMSYGAGWSEFGAVGWQPTGLMGHVGASLGLQVVWGMLGRVWGCRLATYMSYGACWSEFGDVFWQPTGPVMVRVGTALGMYVGNLQVSLRVLGALRQQLTQKLFPLKLR